MKEINCLEYYCGKGVRLSYNGKKYLIEQGDLPGIDSKSNGTIHVVNRKYLQSSNVNVNFRVSCVQSNNMTYINDVSVDNLIIKKDK